MNKMIDFNKKALVFSTVLGCAGLSSLAHAQGSVEMFGVVDMGVSYTTVNGGDKLTALSDNGITTSRIGFRGTEDLGGGLKALFWLESGFTPSTGAGPLSFARRSVVGLSGKFGEVTLGRDYTSGYSMYSSYGGPFGTNGVGHNLVYRARVLTHDANNAGQEAFVRSSNAISYFSPKGDGIYGQATYGFDEQNEGKAGRYMGGRLGYRNKALDISGAYNTIAAGNDAPEATPRKMESTSLGMSYQFDATKLLVLYAHDKIKMPVADKKLNALSVGLETKVDRGAIRAAIGHAELDYVNNTSKATKYSLGYVHNLSKRTALYTTVAYLQNKGGASYVVNPGIKGEPNKNSSGVDFGIRHSF